MLAAAEIMVKADMFGETDRSDCRSVDDVAVEDVASKQWTCRCLAAAVADIERIAARQLMWCCPANTATGLQVDHY